VNGVDTTSIGELFHAELPLRKQIDQLLDFFRKYLPGYQHCRYRASGATIGTRETRRIIGEHIITVDEMAQGKLYPDTVVHKAEFIVDIHNPSGPGQAEAKVQYVPPYDIPYRCFIPKGIDNLLTAGRCISGTHRAHASYRVMSICMAMGQAVGSASALCALQNCSPRQLPAKAIQNSLGSQGVDLFG
jgi:FAD dependent oxidoreductase